MKLHLGRSSPWIPGARVSSRGIDVTLHTLLEVPIPVLLETKSEVLALHSPRAEALPMRGVRAIQTRQNPARTRAAAGLPMPD